MNRNQSLPSSPLNLAIAELVLPPTPGHNPQRIRDAVKQELQSLFAQQDKSSSLQRNMNLGQLNSEPLVTSPSTTAEAIGQQIAQRVYQNSISSPRK